MIPTIREKKLALASEGAMTVEETAVFLGLSTRHVWRLIKDGRLASYRTGRPVRVLRAAAIAFIADRTTAV